MLKFSSIIIRMMGNLSTHLLPSGLSISPSASQSCSSTSFCSIYMFFLGTNSILFLRQIGFHPDQCTLSLILYHSEFISDGLNKLTILLLFQGFELCLAPLSLINLFQLASLIALFDELNIFSDRRAYPVFQNHKGCFF